MKRLYSSLLTAVVLSVLIALLTVTGYATTAAESLAVVIAPEQYAEIEAFVADRQPDGTIENIRILNEGRKGAAYCVECEPSGYYIYSVLLDRFMEYAPESPSPYLEADGPLFYCGMMEYYAKTDTGYINLLTGEPVTQETVERHVEIWNEHCIKQALGDNSEGSRAKETATATEETVEQATLPDSEMKNMFEAFVQKAQKAETEVSGEVEIARIKLITDFQGAVNYCIECVPTGYFIYSVNLGEFLEYSVLSPSPFMGYEDELYYFGMLEYYHKTEAGYVNLLTEEMITPEKAEIYSEIWSKHCQEIMETEADANPDIEDDAELSAEDPGIWEAASAAQTTESGTEVYAAGAGFISDLKTADQIGYADGDKCGYIAAGMLLLYNDCYSSDNFISDAGYTSRMGSSFCGTSFTNLLRSYGNSNSTAAFSILGMQGIDEVISGYLEDHTRTSVSYDSTPNTDLSVMSTIQSTKRPVIVFGRMEDPASGEAINHAVLAYGTGTNELIVHYGYADYSKVHVARSDIVVGSTYRITGYNVADSAQQFTDIGFNWARKNINRCVAHGVMNGTTGTTFEPSSNVTRAMLVTMLYRMAGSPSVTISHPFTDVASGRYYTSAVAWAYQNGIVNGVSATLFDPNADITRSQMVRILYRYSNYCGCSLPTTAYNAIDYPDLSNMTGETLSAWQWAISCEIIKGSNVGSFRYIYPGYNLQRSEAAAIIHRFMAAAGVW